MGLRKLLRFPADCSRLHNKPIGCLFPTDKSSTGYITSVSGGWRHQYWAGVRLPPKYELPGQRWHLASLLFITFLGYQTVKPFHRSTRRRQYHGIEMPGYYPGPLRSAHVDGVLVASGPVWFWPYPDCSRTQAKGILITFKWHIL